MILSKEIQLIKDKVRFVIDLYVFILKNFLTIILVFNISLLFS